RTPAGRGGSAGRSSGRRLATRAQAIVSPMAQEARRALITGIAGQDGSLLAELLLSEGYEVFGIVRRATSEAYENLETVRDRIDLVQADLLDELSLVTALE